MGSECQVNTDHFRSRHETRRSSPHYDTMCGCSPSIRLLEPGGPANATLCGSARARLKRLTASGHLQYLIRLARKELPIETPVISYFPGDQPPPFGKAAYQLMKRWKDQPVVPTEFVIARGEYIPRPASEVTHDIQLAAIYLFYREHSPDTHLQLGFRKNTPSRTLRRTG